jgi:SsrA-binding protein
MSTKEKSALFCYDGRMALLTNKKAHFDYEIIETIPAGIELFGFEAKAVRAGQGSLVGSRIMPRGGEAYLVGASIPALQPANTPKDFDPARNRRLLLTKKEIAKLVGVEKEKGLTIVPISVYNKGRFIKVDIGIARGKKQFDKREVTKKRETERDIRRTLKYD